jgi:hypothetical protein
MIRLLHCVLLNDFVYTIRGRIRKLSIPSPEALMILIAEQLEVTHDGVWPLENS